MREVPSLKGMYKWCGYEVLGMLLLHDLKVAMQLTTVKTCLCVFQLARVMASMY